MECSICSKDEELWPVGSICMGKYWIINGSMPCGCSFPKWKEWQWIIRIKRECKVRGYIFHGWYGPYKANRTKLDLENILTGNRWNTTNIYNFMLGKGDPNQGRIDSGAVRKKSDQSFITSFIDAGFTEDYDFWRCVNFVKRWYYKCPICSYDEYTKVGLCSGVVRENIKILQVFTSNHQTVYDTEQWLHQELRERGFEYNEKDGQWSIELFDMDSLPVLDYLLKHTDLEDVSEEYED